MTTTSNDAEWLQQITMDDLVTDPDTVYDRLREHSPLAFLPVVGAYVASSHELCAAILNSPDFEGVLNPAGNRTFGAGNVIAENGPSHAAIRAMTDPALHASEVDRWVDGLVRPLARERVSRIEDAGRADVLAEYFEPVSVRSLGDLLGLDGVSSDTLRDWFHRLSRSVGNVEVTADGSPANPAGFDDGDAAKAEIRAVVDPLLDHWTEHPDNGSLSHWLHDGMPEGQTRSRDRIYPTLHVFLLGAMQEPGHAMGATLAGLFSRPDQLADVVDDPSLIPRAVAEGMRWVAPLWSAAGRLCVRDTVVAGQPVTAGTVIMLSYGAANRDGDRYQAPSQYDLRREPLPNLAFGGGAHACAGMHFANQVCRIGLEELFEAIPNITPTTGADDTFFGWAFRGPTAVHATWEV